ncbi:class I SAM-dependent methyltransferase [Paenibacillus camerounensis]|uniref:class I SAM-dependent methyltransferase n=1 Tax=Paenibacillus camerounensis TaxID=1243663 RepID=UPI0005AA4FB7|nr:class I SAM-dependent methyltransferase [Paenibacillus camerounensis]
MEINSEKYWDKRFEEDWEAKGGRSQTDYFTNMAIEFLPEGIKEILRNNNVSFLDWGCAEGDGVNIFGQRFPNLKVAGLDFAKSAIRKAQKNYPEYTFYEGTLQEYNKKFDIIFTSNCLEHYNNPLDWAKELSKYTNDMLIIMVPFQERERIKEHFFTFDYDTFPLKLEFFFLTFFKVFNTDPYFWPGKQLLLVYSRQDSANLNRLNLGMYDPITDGHHKQLDYVEKLKEDIKDRDEAAKAINEENKNLSEWINILKAEVSKRDESVAVIKEELKEKDKWITTMEAEVSKREESISIIKNELAEKDKWIKILQDEVRKRDEANAERSE